MISRPEGIILVTGPTGSGKTTTLYSILNHINSDTVNIMTLEDPVEYPMTLIRQTSVNEAAKMDFANGIRSMMRQDPDVILVGEIRDEDTAEMAFRAAMTGHQVYSTLHTNSAVGAFPRLLDIGVTARHHGRQHHRHHRAAADPAPVQALPPALHRDFGRMPPARASSPTGRPPSTARSAATTAITRATAGGWRSWRLLKLDVDLDELIARRATARELQLAAIAKGFRTLADDGSRRVLEGTTTLDELMRVVDLTDRM